jgi:hypothetical protein
VSERLGIVGNPADLDEVLALCAGLNVEPVLMLAPGEVPFLSTTTVIALPDWSVDPCAVLLRDASLAGLWPGTCERSRFVQELSFALDLPHLPCLNERQPAALPIAGATLFDFSDLDHPNAPAVARLPIPAWVRAACTRGDSSCMRLEHPNDLSLAWAKLRKRGMEGPIRIQPVVEGLVYRLLAFKAGSALVMAGLIGEEVTSSVYRVPLSMSIPAEGHDTLLEEANALASQVNVGLPEGWGYVELEFVDTKDGLCLVDVQCPARLDSHLCRLIELSQGIDLRRASLQCALGRVPEIAPSRNTGVAFTWLLTRSGVVTGLQGLDKAREMPGVVEVNIVAEEGHILSHVVDIPSRERGGYIIATGNTAAEARARLEAARSTVWINTSPALF